MNCSFINANGTYQFNKPLNFLLVEKSSACDFIDTDDADDGGCDNEDEFVIIDVDSIRP